MSIDAALYARLSGYTGLTDLISTRIYPNEAFQDATYPYIVYEREGTERAQHLRGDSGLLTTDFQITSYAETKSALLAINAQVVAALHGYIGTSATVTVEYAQVTNEYDGGYNSDLGYYFSFIDIQLIHR